jgi:hypothetical protein
MARFVKSEQNPNFKMHNFPVNMEHVKGIVKAMNGFNYIILFEFNSRQSFEWRYRTSFERDHEYNRLISLMPTSEVEGNAGPTL